MNRTIPGLLLLSCVFALAVPAAPAAAQCADGWVCADFSVGASFGIGIGAPPPRQEQVIIVQPPLPPQPPPVVYVQPAPQPPPPQVVYVQQPAPPPTVVYQPAPQMNYVQQPAVEVEPQGYGLHGSVGGMLTPDLAMGGVHGAFRWRPSMGHFALDLGIGAYGGIDYNGMDRVEVPLTADALFYLNPDSRFQVYGVAGVGLSFAHTENFNDPFLDDFGSARDYAYVGGQAGLGAELRLGRWWAVNVDVRGFIRERVDADSRPEFTEIGEDGELRSTDTSGGFVLNAGATLYW